MKEELKLKSSSIIKILLIVILLMMAVVLARVFLISPAKTMKLASITDIEYDPSVWGKHYPLEYASYLKNKDMAASPTGYGGSEKYQKSTKEPEIDQ